MTVLKSDLKSELENKIKENRPKLTPSSLKTYTSILSSLFKALNGDGGMEWFSENFSEILKYLDTKNNQSKKTTLSALFVLTGKEEYREIMVKTMKEVNDVYKSQKKTVKQEQNWVSPSESKQFM